MLMPGFALQGHMCEFNVDFRLNVNECILDIFGPDSISFTFFMIFNLDFSGFNSAFHKVKTYRS